MTGGRVLVTGAAGFVGGHVASALLDAGWAVTGLDSFDPFYDRALKERSLETLRGRAGFVFHERDAARPGTLLDGVDAVVHLAARPGVRQSVHHAPEYRRLNERVTAALLDACQRRGVRRFVFASSSSVYGRGTVPPFREDAALGAPASPYASSKRAAEALVAAFAARTGGRCAVLRLFSVYGPRQRPDLALCRFTRLLRDGQAVPLYGDGSSRRDYTHVSDVAAGVAAALSWTTGAGAACETFNIGTGDPVRLDYMVMEVAARLGVEPRWDRCSPHPADLPATCASTEKARRVLGVRPVVSIDEGIADYVAWYERDYGHQPCPTA